MLKKGLYYLLAICSGLLLFWAAGCADADALSYAQTALSCAAGAAGLLLALRGVHRINYRAARRRTPLSPAPKPPVPDTAVPLRTAKSA